MSSDFYPHPHAAPRQLPDAKRAGRGAFHPEWSWTISDLPEPAYLFWPP
jgi:hypothetical protein